MCAELSRLRVLFTAGSITSFIVLDQKLIGVARWNIACTSWTASLKASLAARSGILKIRMRDVKVTKAGELRMKSFLVERTVLRTK